MIEVIKYEDYQEKNTLLTILRNSILNFRKTPNYTRIQDQRWESLEISVPVPMLKDGRKYCDVFEKVAKDIYIVSDDYDLSGVRIKPKKIELDEFQIKEHDVIFDDIKDTIIEGIRNSKYLIWVAVAWFTDQDICNELLKKKESGVNVQLILSDDDINRKMIEYLTDKVEITKIPKTGYYKSNGLHDKFCIIDLEYVMHGSYNWSKNAQSNEETLATALDKDFVMKFAEEFIKLKQSYM
jgi:phosphatidylserine/phosphatidylglycerophosphate/cardiolipin synthase-like enzyme